MVSDLPPSCEFQVGFCDFLDPQWYSLQISRDENNRDALNADTWFPPKIGWCRFSAEEAGAAASSLSD